MKSLNLDLGHVRPVVLVFSFPAYDSNVMLVISSAGEPNAEAAARSSDS